MVAFATGMGLPVDRRVPRLMAPVGTTTGARMSEAKTPPGAAGPDAYTGLPLDPDPARTGSVTPPAHLQPRFMLTVLAGAVLGTPTRYVLSAALPTRTGQWPAGTFAANLLGAFLLGALLESLARRGDDAGRRRLLRLGLGTGFLGAFTTYSTLAVEADLLVRAGRPGLAAVYAAGTVLAGLLLSTAGIRIAAAHHRRFRPGPAAPDDREVQP